MLNRTINMVLSGMGKVLHDNNSQLTTIRNASECCDTFILESLESVLHSLCGLHSTYIYTIFTEYSRHIFHYHAAFTSLTVSNE